MARSRNSTQSRTHAHITHARTRIVTSRAATCVMSALECTLRALEKQNNEKPHSKRKGRSRFQSRASHDRLYCTSAASTVLITCAHYQLFCGASCPAAGARIPPGRVSASYHNIVSRARVRMYDNINNSCARHSGNSATGPVQQNYL